MRPHQLTPNSWRNCISGSLNKRLGGDGLPSLSIIASPDRSWYIKVNPCCVRDVALSFEPTLNIRDSSYDGVCDRLRPRQSPSAGTHLHSQVQNQASHGTVGKPNHRRGKPRRIIFPISPHLNYTSQTHRVAILIAMPGDFFPIRTKDWTVHE